MLRILEYKFINHVFVTVETLSKDTTEPLQQSLHAI